MFWFKGGDVINMPELIDVLDENGIKTGRIATRDEVHREGLWHRIAVVVVLDDYNRILLQQRSDNVLTNAGKWDVAAAGHVHAGEDAITTAKRETEEEVGLTITNNDLRFLLTYSGESQYEQNGEMRFDKQHRDCFLLRVPKIKLEDLKLQNSEVQAVKLCTLAEFEDMIAAGVMVNRQPLYDAIIKMMEGKAK